MKYHLRKCKYPIDVINNAITKAKSIDQTIWRTNNVKEVEKTLVLITTYNSGSPDINDIVH